MSKRNNLQQVPALIKLSRHQRYLQSRITVGSILFLSVRLR